MIIDTLNEFSDAQAETTVGAHDSTNIIDLGADFNAAIGRELYLNIIVETAVTSGGAATVQSKLITDEDTGFATSPVTLWDSGAIGKATLVDGYVVARVRVPKGTKRYLKVTYTIGTAALTAGKFDAFLSPSVQDTFAVS